MNIARRFALIAFLLLPAALSAEEATVYRWVDAGGQVHFSQIPPESGKYDLIQGRRPSAPAPGAESGTQTAATTDGGAEQRTREQKFIQEAEARRKAEAEAKQKARTEKAEAEQKCAKARERVTFLEERTGRRLATVAEDGNYTRMPEDEFLKRLDEAKKDVATNCR
jgi:hypothetical protein